MCVCVCVVCVCVCTYTSTYVCTYLHTIFLKRRSSAFTGHAGKTNVIENQTAVIPVGKEKRDNSEHHTHTHQPHV